MNKWNKINNGLFVVLLAITGFGNECLGDEFDHRHGAWDRFLKKNVVVDGRTTQVDYEAIHKDSRDLDVYLAALQKVDEKQFVSWRRSQRLAFLINAYNAYTLRLVADHYPIESIKDIGGLLSNPWKKEFFTLLGKPSHLDHVEHDLIRGRFDEPRIHFALNCASKSCPPLARDAYVPSRLEEQLEKAAENFLGDSENNRYDPDGDRLHLSRIFKWYGQDFENRYGNLRSFVAPRISSDPDVQARIRKGKVPISYLDYDWKLNQIEP